MAGIPSNSISINQAPAYGDKKALDKLRSGLTTTPMTGVKTPAPTAGRPPTSGGGPPASASGAGPQQQVPPIPPEHMTMLQQLAQAARTAQILTQKSQQPDAGPWLRYYAAVATERYQEIAIKVKSETPFFAGV